MRSILFEKRERPALSREASLKSVPILNDDVEIEGLDTGRAVLLIRHRARTRGLMRKLVPDVIEKRIRLDEVGTFVIGQIDGRRSVREMVDAFVERFRVNRREAELSMVDFLKSLVKRRVVLIAVDPSGTQGPAQP